ncbi:hypothetical protein DFH08DRAFT_832327 [Mycena albidolilacea]|uniref:F-box domain-containing protein n=1 Tax=Mycena albidolilacea TaxID=1033008 RepID=A0AAD7F4Q9_9AGAR|nr:hypothetical protein DFH08DRAFT_832327 [Mycena albidolilacea]
MSAHLRKRFAERDTEIVEQERVLDQLRQTRSDVERELHATATYPILTLPTEITAEIFGHCLLVFGVCSIPRTYKRSAPIILSAVCRAWRDITLATPILWSELHVRFDELATGVVTTAGLIEDSLDLWLARAGSRSLSLDFISREGHPFALSRLRDIINRWSHQVEDLCVDIAWRNIQTLGLESAAFPLLQGATLECDYIPALTFFDNSPRFCDLRLRSSSAGFIPSTFTQQLTKFEGLMWTLQLLTLAPNLTEIRCSFEPHPEDHAPTAITHHNVRSLAIFVDEFDDWADILPYLILPALHHLDVSAMDNYDTLESFLARSSPPLVSLSVKGTTSCFDHWSPCTALVDGTLENLEVWGVSNQKMPSIFTFLYPLPNIQSLCFKDLEDPLNLHLLLQSLYERSLKLRSFRVDWGFGRFIESSLIPAGPPISDTIGGHLSRLARLGMDIDLGKNYVSIGDIVIGRQKI